VGSVRTRAHLNDTIRVEKETLEIITTEDEPKIKLHIGYGVQDTRSEDIPSPLPTSLDFVATERPHSDFHDSY
jgi:hypothetical protein